MKAKKIAFLINEVRESVNDLGVDKDNYIIKNIIYRYINNADKALDVLILIKNNNDAILVDKFHLLLNYGCSIDNKNILNYEYFTGYIIYKGYKRVYSIKDDNLVHLIKSEYVADFRNSCIKYRKEEVSK